MNTKSMRLPDKTLKKIDLLKIRNLRQIPTCEGYFVNRYGEVYSIKKLQPRLHSDGYFRFCLFGKKKRRQLGVHQAVAFAFLRKPKKNEKEIRHMDGDKTNNLPSNLKWGTRSDNARDLVRHGQSMRGEKSSTAKLNRSQVVMIRSLARKMKHHRIAKLFEVSRPTITAIVNKRNWGWL